MNTEKLLFRQLFDKETSTYTYLVADAKTKDAIIIDTVKEHLERDLTIIKELGLKLNYILDTHVHADHVTDSYDLRKATGAKIVAGAGTNLKCADILLNDNETLTFGNITVKALATPGHTDGCTSYQIEDMVFTGDTLLIRSCGRVDFQQGSAENMYNSLQKLFKLEDATLVYPAHDYQGRTCSTIGEEKQFNQYLGNNKSKEQFIKELNELQLPMPKHIKVSVPSNMICGEKVISA